MFPSKSPGDNIKEVATILILEEDYVMYLQNTQ